jgi:anthranilate/para-aminobenzoate synthase component I
LLRFAVAGRPARPAEVDAALARLDAEPGLYFGCDAGVAGLHPLQATLVAAPAIRFEVFEDGVEATALDAFGAALLAEPSLDAFRDSLGRRGEVSPIDSLRRFLASFGHGSLGGAEGRAGRAGQRHAAGESVVDADPAADALLLGAFRFEAHRLVATSRAPGPRHSSSLGVLFFSPELLRRDSSGAWQNVALRFENPALAALRFERESHAAAASDVATVDTSIASRTAQSDGLGDAALSPGSEPRDDFAPGGYAAVVARAVERLAEQPLVSLTLSQSFRRRVGTASPAAAFATLRRVNPAPATFFVNTGDGERVFGASPDLQLHVRGRAIESFPVCGTVARGHGPVGEAESLRQLINEDVDAASLAVCTDALRNDLAPLCEPGSLRLHDRRRPMALATVVHTVDRFGGELRDGADAWDAIVATAAPVMVTGTPRRVALAAIADLEAGPRGWYGGLAVQVAANGDALVGTILRAAAIRDGIAEVRTGGDLLADSEPAREEHESRVKAVSLWRALGLSVPTDLQSAIAGGADGASAQDAVGHATPTPAPSGALPRAVALRDAGDPFSAAVIDALQTCGVALDAAAEPVVWIGSQVSTSGDDDSSAAAGGVAIGDAAARVLEKFGWTVRPIRPEHGRFVHCSPTAAAPVALQRRPFVAMRYATLAVEPAPNGAGADAAAAWHVWFRDDADRPLVLADARRRIVCLLIRPESLLSDPVALDVLKAALAFAAEPAS